MPSSRVFACLPIVLAATVASAAQQNEYGGYDIVGAVPGEEYHYSDVRGWRVLVSQAGQQFAYCVAEMERSDGSAFRVGWDGLQWQVAVPIEARPDWQGKLQIDGAGSGQGYLRGGDDISGTAVPGWTIAWLGLAELDGLRKGKTAILGVGKFDYDFALSGMTAATLKVEECVERSGQTASDAPSAERTATQFGNAGSWIINKIGSSGRVEACEVYDTTKPSLRFEIDSENSYIDFKDGGNMGDLGDRIAISVSFGPGSTPSEAEVDIIEGRDGEKWARITENRSEGPGYLDDAIPNARQVSFSGPNIILETDLAGSNRALKVFFQCMESVQ